MADRDGFHSDGTVHIPALFRGTVRLADGPPPTPAPIPDGPDILPGTFSMQLDITFAMLLEMGFVPVHPAHPAYPRYLEAHAARDRAPPVASGDPHRSLENYFGADTIVVPFETTFHLEPEMHLQYGLVPPGSILAASDHPALEEEFDRRPRPPTPTLDPFGLRDQTDHPRLDDFGAFLDFLGDPHRHESPSRGVPAALPGLDPVAGFPGLPGEPGIDGLPVLPAILPLDETEKRNIADLADLMWTEARGAGEAAMIAVGCALRNRMLRNKTRRVDETWHGFSHGEKPTGRDRFKVEMLAQSILDGSRPDPTHGATHFYSPVTMPKEGASKADLANWDVGGRLESVPGVMKDGHAVRNYRPSWTASFVEEPVDGVPEITFKFYRPRYDGTVG